MFLGRRIPENCLQGCSTAMKKMGISKGGGSGWGGGEAGGQATSHPSVPQTGPAFICGRIPLRKQEKHFRFAVVVQTGQSWELDGSGFQTVLQRQCV